MPGIARRRSRDDCGASLDSTLPDRRKEADLFDESCADPIADLTQKSHCRLDH